MELITTRLIIRNFNVNAINDAYLMALNDFSVVGMTEARHIIWSRDNAMEFIMKANSHCSALFEVLIDKKNKPIGNVRLFNINHIHKRAELSMLFYDKKEWSKGYATEAIGAIINYAFNELKLHRITADFYATNIASSKVFGKLGFDNEGLFRDHFCIGDSEFVDSVRVGLINMKKK